MDKHKIIVIDDRIAARLAVDTKVFEMFPAVRVAVENSRAQAESSVKVAKCKPCHAGVIRSHVRTMAIKVAIAQLSVEDRQKLKDHLNTQQVRIVFKTKDGKTTQIDF